MHGICILQYNSTQALERLRKAADATAVRIFVRASSRPRPRGKRVPDAEGRAFCLSDGIFFRRASSLSQWDTSRLRACFR